jgi:hypothetical protein
MQAKEHRNNTFILEFKNSCSWFLYRIFLYAIHVPCNYRHRPHVALQLCTPEMRSRKFNLDPFLNIIINEILRIRFIERYKGPPLWSDYRSRGTGFDSRRFQIFWEAAGLERGPLSLVRTSEELLEGKSSGSGLENRATPSIRKSWH